MISLSYLADPFVVFDDQTLTLRHAQDIPFWSALARRNKLLYRTWRAKHIGQDHEYEHCDRRLKRAGYSARSSRCTDEAKGVSLRLARSRWRPPHGIFWATKRDFGWFLCVLAPASTTLPQR